MFSIPPPGYYQFELWGAQGGDARFGNSNDIRPGSGGKGAFVSGNLSLIGTQELFLYIGGKGENQESIEPGVMSKGGFNGGGNGGVDKVDSTQPESSAGGGGATDIRIIHGTSREALKSRLMIAAGGGGATSTNSVNPGHHYQGGDGGTLSGSTNCTSSEPGTQTSGNFGSGQNGLSFTKEDYTSGGSTGGGGGGYYGGTSIKPPNHPLGYQDSAGAGGSSYVSGFEGCKAVLFEDVNGEIAYSSSSIHYTNTYFDDPIMKMRGDDGFEGNSGNGFAKITIIRTYYSVPMFPTIFEKQHLNSHIFYVIAFTL